jgi:tetratricopeptide (TPR) repeat protein
MKILLMAFLLLCANFSHAQSSEQEILRLKKGEYYYHYLTGDYLSAMNQLQQWRSNNGVIANEADVMKAAMLLSLGLHQQAQSIFEDIQQGGSIASSKAWFFLARRWFELGEYESTLYSITNIAPTDLLAEDLTEAQFMKAASLIELGKHKKALVMINNMPRSSIWAGYARHNLILDIFKGNKSGQSLTLLIENATFYLPETEEGQNLRDRIHLVSAIYFLQTGQHRSAEKHLKSISLAGPYTPSALLQYGWAKVEQGKYEEALQPWRELQIRFNQFDPEVMESMLGVPHVLELMNADTQALNIYEMTEKRLLSMKAFLIQMSEGLADNPWLEDWVFNQKDQSWGWQAKIETTFPLNDTTAVLQQLVTNEKLVNQMTEYRDLLLLTNYLSEKEESLRSWLVMVDKRERATKSRNVLPILEQSSEKIKAVKDELRFFENRLINSIDDVFALPSENETKSIELLSLVAKRIERLAQVNKASRNVEKYQQRWARVKGVFLWEMNSIKTHRQWELKKQLVAIGRLLKTVDAQLIKTRLANQWSPSAWLGMKEKIWVVLKRINILKKISTQAMIDSKTVLLMDSTQYLDTQIYRINDYLSQSRMSIARLYDEALQNDVNLDVLSEEEQTQ